MSAPDPPVAACSAWIAPDDMVCCCPVTDQAALGYALDLASDILGSLGGVTYGTCTEQALYDPCLCSCVMPGCGCVWFTLDQTPVKSVELFVPDAVGGWVTVPPTAYGVDAVTGEVLILNSQVLQPHFGMPVMASWSYGADPGPAAVAAITEFACELAKKCLGIACSLPQRITTVTREGVSFALIDPMEFLKSGRTGLLGVDLWLQTLRPYGQNGGGFMIDPTDVPLRRVIYPVA